MSNHCPDKASLTHVKDWKQSNKMKLRNLFSCQLVQLYVFTMIMQHFIDIQKATLMYVQ